MGPAGPITFQRCTNKSMGDIQKQQQQQEEDSKLDRGIVFGAPDELGATKRQICGAAVAGGMVGAFLGPVSAVTLATGAAMAAAKRECEIGEAARSVGDAVCSSSARLLTEERVDRTVEGSCRRVTQVNQSLTKTAQQCSVRANKGANDFHEKFSRTKEKYSQKASSMKEKGSQRAILMKEKAGQIKQRAAQAKARVSSKFARRKNRQGGDEVDETEFHDCHDDFEEFEDAVESDSNDENS